MDWIYKSPASQVDREQYLLGKKIDRQVDPLLASDDRERQVRGSSVRCLLALSLSLSLSLYDRPWPAGLGPCSLVPTRPAPLQTLQ